VLLILGGIGLLLVGLLAGVLLMEWRFQQVQMAAAPARIVERVQLGGGERVGAVTLPEGDGRRLALDPVVLNQVFREVAERVTPAVVYIEVTAGSRGFPAISSTDSIRIRSVSSGSSRPGRAWAAA